MLLKGEGSAEGRGKIPLPSKKRPKALKFLSFSSL